MSLTPDSNKGLKEGGRVNMKKISDIRAKVKCEEGEGRKVKYQKKKRRVIVGEGTGRERGEGQRAKNHKKNKKNRFLG